MSKGKRNRNRQRQNNSLLPAGPDSLSPQVVEPFGGTQAALVATRTSFSGPLPSPEALKEFEAIVPGMAKGIYHSFLRQTRHRIKQEDRVIYHNIVKSYLGLASGFLLALTAVVGGVILAWHDHDGAGGTIATVGVAALAGVFVYGTAHRREAEADARQGKPKKK